MKSISMGEHTSIVSSAFHRQFGDVYVMEVFADHVIVQDYSTPLYARVSYTMDGIHVTFAPRDLWERVEREYVPVAFGSEIKTLGEGKVGGYLIVYGDDNAPDLEGDFFSKSTDFYFEDGDTRPVVYLHGLDGNIKKRKIGSATLKRDDVGVWIEAQLNMRDDYEKAIAQLAKDGQLGWSSGAAAHLVERERVGKTSHIRKWAIAEASLTPAPAEPRARVIYVKSLQDLALKLPEAQPEGSKDPAGAADGGGVVVTVKKYEDETMSDEHLKSLRDENAALKTQLDGLSGQLSEVMKLIQDAPALKGYTSVDGGTADKNIKSLGDFLLSVMRNDQVRLTGVYKTTMTGDVGQFGGYSVPTEYSTALLTAAREASQVYNRVRRIPTTSSAGQLPVLDTFSAPTAGSGNTAAAAGVKTAKRAEGAAYSETEAQLEMVNYKINDIASGLIQVSKELRADSVLAIETVLTTVIANAVSAKMEYYILRGTGSGEPLGIQNAPALVGVAAAASNTFAYADAVSMVSRLKAAGGSPVWVMHPGTITDVANMAVGSNSPATWTQDPAAQLRGTLLGYPLITSEHLPNPDSSGHVILADLGAYVLFERGGMYLEFSEHRYFDLGRDAWRFGIRADGQPWWKGTQTLASPSAFTVSPFINFTN